MVENGKEHRFKYWATRSSVRSFTPSLVGKWLIGWLFCLCFFLFSTIVPYHYFRYSLMRFVPSVMALRIYGSKSSIFSPSVLAPSLTNSVISPGFFKRMADSKAVFPSLSAIFKSEFHSTSSCSSGALSFEDVDLMAWWRGDSPAAFLAFGSAWCFSSTSQALTEPDNAAIWRGVLPEESVVLTI